MERALVYWLWEETRVKEVVGSNPQMVGTDESTELPMAAPNQVEISNSSFRETHLTEMPIWNGHDFCLLVCQLFHLVT